MTDTEETGYQVGPNDLAFPSISYEGIDSSGLTKREYFAAMAASNLDPQSYIDYFGDPTGGITTSRYQYLAMDAVTIADALIEALNK